MLTVEQHCFSMKIRPLESESPVIVYIDFKSPYAYLAVEPTRQLEQQLGVEFDWRPFVLDIPSYLGSARLDSSGNVAEQNRSAIQWRGIKYAYADCRRYARIHKQNIRGTEKIWDTNLVSTAMLWVKQYGRKALDDFIDRVYLPFWKRELDLEDLATINALIESCADDKNNFTAWMENVGMKANFKLQREAFEAGIHGVPTFVVNNELYFGREHLPRIEWLLGDKLSQAPDIAYSLPNYKYDLPKLNNKEICIGIDNSLDSYLAIRPLQNMLNQHNLNAKWVSIERPNPEPLSPIEEDQSRGAKHKHYRQKNTQANNMRYCPDGLSYIDISAEIIQELRRQGISLSTNTPNDVPDDIPIPGVTIKITDELFIGRQHLPLISALISYKALE